MVNDIIQQELETCLYLCDRLEDVLKRDASEIEQCMTGILCDEYRKNIQKSQDSLAALRKQISNLHNLCATIM